jgi:curved DNA-binding protein CbpA
VLRVDPTAHWEDIVLAYRKLARWWHPDGLVDATDDEREACELRIRELNDAYQKLRVRRGR